MSCGRLCLILEISHNQLHVFLQILLAAGTGSIIGWQRQMHGSAAGLRTHILVCTGATLLTVIDMLHGAAFQGKIAAAVVSGIGFLGAGTIIHSEKGDTVRGLTTAASVWVTAGIGVALGAGGISTLAGVFVAALVLGTLSIVYRIEDYVLRKKRNRKLTIVILRPEGGKADDILKRVLSSVTNVGAAVEGIVKDQKGVHQGELIVHCQIRLPDGFHSETVLQACASDISVVQVAWDI